MKKFTVVWGQDATDGLTEAWLASESRNELSAAIRAIDSLLASDPYGLQTDELAEGLRMVAVGLIRTSFAVADDDRLVEIVGISCLPPRRSS